MSWKITWPLMWKSTHEAVRRENYTLRDALKEANKELFRHRQALAALKEPIAEYGKPSLKGKEKLI